jgi:hypothetical protein
LTRQPHLLNGPLLPYALEIRQLSSNASKTAKHVQNAYLWKYIYSCVRNYKKTYPDWLFLYFECLNTTAPSELLNWIYDKYKIDLPFHSIQPATSKNLIRGGEGKLCSSNYRNVLSAEEIQDILTITHDVAISFYKESDITIPLAAT